MKRTGFTLIELPVVVAIVALLMGILLPSRRLGRLVRLRPHGDQPENAVALG